MADDDPLILRTLTAIVEYEAGLELVGVAEETAAAIELAAGADVLIADLRMPGGGAVRAARELREAGHATAVVALTGYDSPADREALAAAGAVACLVKGCPIEDIVEALRTAAAAAYAGSRDGSRRFATSSSTAPEPNGTSASSASSA